VIQRDSDSDPKAIDLKAHMGSDQLGDTEQWHCRQSASVGRAMLCQRSLYPPGLLAASAQKRRWAAVHHGTDLVECMTSGDTRQEV